MARASEAARVSSPRFNLQIQAPPSASAVVRFLRRHLPAIARQASIRRGELAIWLVRDPMMRKLHRRHLNLPTTTDVLSFDLRESPRQPLDAQLVVCLDVARRQARLRGHAPELEVLLYAVHGLLHMLGHDDLEPAAAAAMHRREDRLLRAVGLPAVYAQQPRKVGTSPRRS